MSKSDTEGGDEDRRSVESADPRPSAAMQAERTPLEPMPPELSTIQPGGGVVIRLEMAWGRLRRWYLKTFRKGYIARMQKLRQGDRNGCPHEVLDPRDLKFYRNQPGYYWAPEDDPFRYRERIPFARVGLAELLVFSLLTYGVAGVLAAVIWTAQLQGAAAYAGWTVVMGLLVVGVLITWFFRDPRREIPQGSELVVAPADGTIVAVEDIVHDEFVGGPAVLVGIFLSIFNVHINRSPVAARVIGLRYMPGKYLNALRPESARENEQLAIRLEQSTAPHRRMIVRQITGAIARRIVCWLKPGDELQAGEQFGMIKLGSRTELVIPKEPGLEIHVKIGDSVKAGATLIARYAADAPAIRGAESPDKTSGERGM
jgi:phosphatidylserine decarboxylase